ncbi:PREDICTED: uncharacterized protein LOC105460439 [Wasmannia auropunctata]|uniref:uncharacterized protein LOC105460439 n=1 Tax=Wasmannia auropunctata TaxID=64793 RepID=UPI0005EE1136|nr:PREDICTED: uncharacterized protein LOC105460439 [Wasmannia auropunctata]
MIAESFFEYISNVFYSWLLQNKIPRLVILYVDGHCSHLTMPLSQFCAQNGIELIALYPNATHLMQHLDVAFFCSLNSLEENGARMAYKTIWKMFKKYFECSRNNGFQACGLLPFSVDVLQYNSLLMKQNLNNINNVQEFSKEEQQKYLKIFEQFIAAEILKTFTKARKKKFGTMNLKIILFGCHFKIF